MKVGLAIVLSLFVVWAANAQSNLSGWVLSEFQPNIPNGGRADTIAVHPTNNDIMIVASESGGLFRSVDRGVHWQHIDAFPNPFASAVAYLPADPDIVIATAREDYQATNGGGIWRSPDGGTTWTQMPSPPAPPGVSARLSAHEIAVADDGTIYVATDYGVSYSIDRGLTWNHADPFGTGNRNVRSVAARRGALVYAGGPSGLRISPDGGTTWNPPTTGPASIVDRHALAASPVEDVQAYAVASDKKLFYTEDGGNTWREITSANTTSGCGGIAFIKAVIHYRSVWPWSPAVRFVDLWYGNRCGVERLKCPPIDGTSRFSYIWPWDTVTVDHADSRDLAFTTTTNAPEPLLLGTDGGLHSPSNAFGLNWTYTGGGPNGYNALQLTEVKGQWIRDIGRYDLYIGTQDNDLWASTDGGTTWGNRQTAEGFFIERLPSVATAADSKVTFVACWTCNDKVSDAAFTNAAAWPDATPTDDGNPKIVFSRFFVEGVNAGAGFNKGLAGTQNLGGTWSQYVRFPEDRKDLPKLSDPGIPVLYQSIKTGWDGARNHEINKLVRIVHNVAPGTPTGTARYPSMTNFGGLGLNPTMFAFYQVFAPDPYDVTRLIAPDVVNQKMMTTADGGDTWTEIPLLTSMVTDSGRFLFNRGIASHASAVSFSHDDPDLVAVGTMQHGLFVSGDRGSTWTRVPNSERATVITSVEWRTLSEATISTYGRGLWKLWWRIRKPWNDFERFCRVPCTVRWLGLANPPGWRNASFVLNGTLQGAVVSDGVVKEVFVSPGGSVVTFSDDAKDVPSWRVTESAKFVGFTGMKAPEAPKNAPLPLGLALLDGKVAGVVFSDKAVKSYEPTQKEKDAAGVLIGSEKSPTAGKPYLSVMTGNGSGGAVAPGAPVAVEGTGFAAYATVQILVDDAVVEQIKAGGNGAFAITVVAPQTRGLHTLKVADAKGPLAGSMFLVKSVDENK